ncbi:MAG: AlbA family DNA-binding domain-containing protein [Thermoplasmata archaeon]
MRATPEPTGTYLEFVRLSGLKFDESSLQQYLGTVVKEDTNAEFKSASRDSDFQVRKAVASIGNRLGGEVFVGVTEPDLKLEGTSLTEDALLDRLRQRLAPGPWFSVDASMLVTQTRSVPLADPAKRVIIADVRRGLLPTLVVDEAGTFGDPGNLIWFRRHGRTDRKLTAYEGVEARRDYARGELLMELYREFETVTRSIPWNPPRGAPVARAYFSLPRYDGSRRDGSFYQSLAPEDLDILLARRTGDPNSQWSPGILPRLIATGERLDRRVESFQSDDKLGKNPDWEVVVGNDVRIAASQARIDCEQVANHLVALGLIPKGPK